MNYLYHLRIHYDKRLYMNAIFPVEPTVLTKPPEVSFTTSVPNDILTKIGNIWILMNQFFLILRTKNCSFHFTHSFISQI